MKRVFKISVDLDSAQELMDQQFAKDDALVTATQTSETLLLGPKHSQFRLSSKQSG